MLSVGAVSSFCAYSLQLQMMPAYSRLKLNFKTGFVEQASFEYLSLSASFPPAWPSPLRVSDTPCDQSKHFKLWRGLLEEQHTYHI